MILRALLAVAVFASTPAVPQTPAMTPDKLRLLIPAVEPEQPDIVFQDYPLVKRIDCLEGKGTGFRVGENHMFSVAHVAELHECGIDQFPISVTEQDKTNDFAKLNVAIGEPNGFAIDCGGFRPGHWYWAVGHALGADLQTAVAIYATIYFDGTGKRIFVGKHTVIPGMSGGPVIDPDTGKVVGTVNAYEPTESLSISRELKQTSVCQGRA